MEVKHFLRQVLDFIKEDGVNFLTFFVPGLISIYFIRPELFDHSSFKWIGISSIAYIARAFFSPYYLLVFSPLIIIPVWVIYVVVDEVIKCLDSGHTG